jgi:hypothetical protein
MVKETVGSGYSAGYHLLKSCETGNLAMCRCLVGMIFLSLVSLVMIYMILIRWFPSGCGIVPPDVIWTSPHTEYLANDTPISVAQRFGKSNIVEFLEKEVENRKKNGTKAKVITTLFGDEEEAVVNERLGFLEEEKASKEVLAQACEEEEIPQDESDESLLSRESVVAVDDVGSKSRLTRRVSLASSSRKTGAVGFMAFIDDSPPSSSSSPSPSSRSPPRLSQSGSLSQELRSTSSSSIASMAFHLTPRSRTPRVPMTPSSSSSSSSSVLSSSPSPNQKKENVKPFNRCVHCGAEKYERSVVDRIVCASMRELYGKMYSYFTDQIAKSESDAERKALAAAFLKFEQEVFWTISGHSRRRFRTTNKDSRRYSGKNFTNDAYHNNVSLFDPISQKKNSVEAVFELFEWLLEAPYDDVNMFIGSLDIPFVSKLRKEEVGVSLLHLVCSLGKVEVAMSLMEAGFPSNVTAKNGKLPLHCFIEKGFSLRLSERPEEEDISFHTFYCNLLKGVDVSYVLPATSFTLYSGTFRNRLSTIDNLIYNVDRSVKETALEVGDSLLHCAVKAEALSLVSLLLTSYGADVNSVNSKGESILLSAMSCPNEKIGMEMLKALLSRTSKELMRKIGPSLLKSGTHSISL